MSKSINIDFTCPICNNSEKFTIFTSITVPESKNLKEKLFKNELNMFNCTTCKSSCKIEVPILYHDMNNQFALWYSMYKSFVPAPPLNRHYLFNTKVVKVLQSLKLEIVLLENKIQTTETKL